MFGADAIEGQFEHAVRQNRLEATKIVPSRSIAGVDGPGVVVRTIPV